MLCRLNKTKWRVSGFKNGKFKSSWQKRPSCFPSVMVSEQWESKIGKSLEV